MNKFMGITSAIVAGLISVQQAFAAVAVDEVNRVVVLTGESATEFQTILDSIKPSDADYLINKHNVVKGFENRRTVITRAIELKEDAILLHFAEYVGVVDGVQDPRIFRFGTNAGVTQEGKVILSGAIPEVLTDNRFRIGESLEKLECKTRIVGDIGGYPGMRNSVCALNL